VDLSRRPGAVKAARSAPGGLGLEGEDWREIVVNRERGPSVSFLAARFAEEHGARFAGGVLWSGAVIKCDVRCGTAPGGDGRNEVSAAGAGLCADYMKAGLSDASSRA
jgi:hypothetical protein